MFKTSKLRNAFGNPEQLFLIIGSFFGIIAVFMMPALTPPDEGAHFWISYGVFSNHKQIPKDLLVPAEASVKEVSKDTYIRDILERKVDLSNDGFGLTIYKQIHTTDRNGLPSTYPVSVFDIPHLPQALGILIGRLVYPSLGVMITLGRIANLALYLVGIYFIIKHVRRGKLVFMFIALFPMLIQQAASLSYDPFNVLAVFGWVALMINLFTQESALSRRQFIGVCVGVLALIVSKRSNVLLLAFIPLLPSSLYSGVRTFSWLTSHLTFIPDKRMLRRLMVGSGALSIAILFVAFYLYLHSRGIGGIQFASAMLNTFFRPEVNNFLDSAITSGIVGNFGWLWYRLPEWIVIFHLLVLAILLLAEKFLKVTRLFAMTSLMVLLLSVAAISFGMYFFWTLQPFVGGKDAHFAQGIQGRYFTPLLVLLIPVAAYVQRYFSVNATRRAMTNLAVVTSVFSLSVYLVLTYVFFYTSATGVKDILLK